jgi:cell pole-organizing protein PopZ
MRIPVIVIALFASSVIAQPLYKSVNAQGEVTFSDSPPPNAVELEEIQVQPGPSEAQLQESAERVKRIEAQANDLGAANAERTQQRQQAQQGQQQAKENEVQPVTDYNNGYSYPNRPLYPPVIKPPMRPEHPIAPDGPGRPAQLPAAPIMAPGR